MAHKDSLIEPKEDLLPAFDFANYFTPEVIQEIVRVMDAGVQVYGKDNWRTPPYLPQKELLRSALRHVRAIRDGDVLNADRVVDGKILSVYHAANLVCNGLFLLTGEIEGWWKADTDRAEEAVNSSDEFSVPAVNLVKRISVPEERVSKPVTSEEMGVMDIGGIRKYLIDKIQQQKTVARTPEPPVTLAPTTESTRKKTIETVYVLPAGVPALGARKRNPVPGGAVNTPPVREEIIEEDTDELIDLLGGDDQGSVFTDEEIESIIAR